MRRWLELSRFRGIVCTGFDTRPVHEGFDRLAERMEAEGWELSALAEFARSHGAWKRELEEEGAQVVAVWRRQDDEGFDEFCALVERR